MNEQKPLISTKKTRFGLVVVAIKHQHIGLVAKLNTTHARPATIIAVLFNCRDYFISEPGITTPLIRGYQLRFKSGVNRYYSAGEIKLYSPLESIVFQADDD